MTRNAPAPMPSLTKRSCARQLMAPNPPANPLLWQWASARTQAADNQARFFSTAFNRKLIAVHCAWLVKCDHSRRTNKNMRASGSTCSRLTTEKSFTGVALPRGLPIRRA
jgi:hypothetical protein